MDDSVSTVFLLDADNVIWGPVREERPTLAIRCKAGDTEAYIVWGMRAPVARDRSHSLRVRVDVEPPTIEHWKESTNDRALFADYPIALIKESQRLRRCDADVGAAAARGHRGAVVGDS